MSFRTFAAVFCGLVLVITSSAPVHAQGTQYRCTGEVRIRKEIHDLTQTERNTLIRGFWRLSQTPFDSNSDATVLEHFMWEHNRHRLHVHNGAPFLPYHRSLLLRIEDKFRELVDPAFTMPYWNWTIFSQDPWNDPVLSPSWLGDTASERDRNDCVRTGPFADFTIAGMCLNRTYVHGERRGQSVTDLWEFLDLNITRETNFFRVANFIEEKHWMMHNFIGGQMADLGVAPAEPLFYLHHAFTDAQWDYWQSLHDQDTNDYFGVNRDRRRVSSNDSLPGGGSIKDYLNSGCVRYAPTTLNMRTAHLLRPVATFNGATFERPKPLPPGFVNQTMTDPKELERRRKAEETLWREASKSAQDKMAETANNTALSVRPTVFGMSLVGLISALQLVM